MAELRSFIFLSRLQPQTMCYLGTWIRGSLPRSHVAAQVIEIAPGLDIEPLTDVAVKHADVRAGILVVERQFGYLEVHGGTDEVQAAASAVLGALGATARDARRPEILASKIITMLDPQQAFLVNRNKIGSMAFLEVEAEGNGQRLIAFDVLGSGVGERVLVAQGSVAAAWFAGHPPPVDALIIGSIDPPPKGPEGPGAPAAPAPGQAAESHE